MISTSFKTALVIAITFIFLSCDSKNQQLASNNNSFEQLKDSLYFNLKDDNFNQIVKIIKNQKDIEFTDSQLKVLNDLTIKLIIKQKDLYVKNSETKKDTIFNNFVLNASKKQYNTRLAELNKEGNYKFGRLSTAIGVVEGNVSQFSSDKGSTRLLVRPFFDKAKLTSLELHSFDQVGDDPLNAEFVKSYGKPLSGIDIATGLNELRKANLEWLGVSKAIKENTFNPIKSFMLMGGELSKEEFKNYNNFWFTENFVISEISILHVYQTHKEFLTDYQQKLDDIKKSKKNIKF